MSKPIILSTQPLDANAEQKLAQHGEFPIVKEPTEAGLHAEAADAIAFVIRGQVPATPRLMNAAPHLKVIGRTGVGYETVDIPAATARGIPVVNAPGACARAVAEAAMTFMLSLCKLRPLGSRDQARQLELPHWWQAVRRPRWQDARDHRAGAHREDRGQARPAVRNEHHRARPLPGSANCRRPRRQAGEPGRGHVAIGFHHPALPAERRNHEYDQPPVAHSSQTRVLLHQPCAWRHC
ncbi:MAG: hypothetical protein IT507_14065 [Burkholderiaceae bacterium]|nr:hypothetical protein [Burkholderiaceae bacterium]